jgi:hypothetical protein
MRIREVQVRFSVRIRLYLLTELCHSYSGYRYPETDQVRFSSSDFRLSGGEYEDDCLLGCYAV